MATSLHLIDWCIIGVYVAVVMAIGAYYSRRASSSVESFFVGDRRLPWWVAGTSIVATTFAADTPLAVTGIVATGGIAGNWLWWSWAIAHLTATFFFARLWRRSGVITDAEITELRYGGRPAAWLRGFKAIYFGVFINCLTMAWVLRAMVKISQAFFDVPALWVIVIAVLVAVAYTVMGGFHSVVASDLLQFALGMAGAVALAVLVLTRFGGMGVDASGAPTTQGLIPALQGALASSGRSLSEIVDFVPGPDHPSTPRLFFVVLLIAGWWRYAEGNGYIVQRLAACRDEAQAQAASLWFAVAHNALRPWPWIVVGVAALVSFPQISQDPPAQLVLRSDAGREISLRPGHLDLVKGGDLEVTGVAAGSRVQIGEQRVPLVPDGDRLRAHFDRFAASARLDVLVVDAADGQPYRGRGLVVQLGDREMAYPLMMGRFLPVGLLGLVIASLLAAFMSTIDTHTNWGASYLVRDIYLRFVHPGASEQRALWVSRASIIGMAIVAGAAATVIDSIASVWRFLVMLGAGLGSVSALRWYWHRVTPQAEFAAMAVTTVLAIALQVFCAPTLLGSSNPVFIFALPAWAQIVIIALASLATWIPVSLWGPRNDEASLRRFARRVQPPGPGFRGYRDNEGEPLWPSLRRFGAGALCLFGALFGSGHLLLGSTLWGVALMLLSAGGLAVIVRTPVSPLATLESEQRLTKR